MPRRYKVGCMKESVIEDDPMSLQWVVIASHQTFGSAYCQGTEIHSLGRKHLHHLVVDVI